MSEHYNEADTPSPKKAKVYEAADEPVAVIDPEMAMQAQEVEQTDQAEDVQLVEAQLAEEEGEAASLAQEEEASLDAGLQLLTELERQLLAPDPHSEVVSATSGL
eukprot:m.69389 g.69389  ORF g.69389 m.69389 type:complete len:105 (-) comp14122_c0_seq2:1114-1428(-)